MDRPVGDALTGPRSANPKQLVARSAALAGRVWRGATEQAGFVARHAAAQSTVHAYVRMGVWHGLSALPGRERRRPTDVRVPSCCGNYQLVFLDENL
jgi:hypothetical protein